MIANLRQILKYYRARAFGFQSPASGFLFQTERGSTVSLMAQGQDGDFQI
jgi:hypothetical protein